MCLLFINRSPSLREQKWIVDNCRTAPEKEQGPRKDLYEEWQEPQVAPKKRSTHSFSHHGPKDLLRAPSRARFDSEMVNTSLIYFIFFITSFHISSSLILSAAAKRQLANGGYRV